jgi:hypothetical protein
MMTDRMISELPQLVETLSFDERKIWDRIYTVSQREGKLILPDALAAEREKYAPFLHQRIIRVTNRISHESTLFNELRARRPFEARLTETSLHEIEESRDDPFCHPEEHTPPDVFGRVEGRHCLTASNLAKYDALHAVIIFREHEPFVSDAEKIRDFLDVAHAWFLRAHAYDPAARFPFFMWNCLWRAGASIIHGHAQVLLSVEPYCHVGQWLRIRSAYEERYGSDYGEDVYHLHAALGLGRSYREGMILSYLTPLKEKEIVILAPSTESLPPLISRVLTTYHRLEVRSFNLAILQPPLDAPGPVMARIVDRGDLLTRTSDIGGMELYGGTAVVSSDPFRMIEMIE